MKKYLEKLDDSQKNIQFYTNNPERLAYLFRQALHVLQYFERFQHWWHLPQNWTVSERADSVILKYNMGAAMVEPQDMPIPNARFDRRSKATQRQVDLPEDMIEPGVLAREAPDTPQEEDLVENTEQITVKDVELDYTEPLDARKRSEYVEKKALTIDMPFSSASGIIGAVIKHKEEAGEIYFPNASLQEEQLEKIWKWTQNHKEDSWKLIEHLGEGITLTTKDSPQEILWTPGGENAQED